MESVTQNAKLSQELQLQQLRRRCDPNQFAFETTSELEELTEVLGQLRAVDAIEFGIGIRREGYHLFAMGPTGVGKHTIVRRFLDRRAAAEEVPPDWCYVHNFQQPHKPRAIRFPSGKAQKFSQEMERLVEDLRAAIPAAFETDSTERGDTKSTRSSMTAKKRPLEKFASARQNKRSHSSKRPAVVWRLRRCVTER